MHLVSYWSLTDIRCLYVNIVIIHVRAFSQFHNTKHNFFDSSYFPVLTILFVWNWPPDHDSFWGVRCMAHNLFQQVCWGRCSHTRSSHIRHRTTRQRCGKFFFKDICNIFFALILLWIIIDSLFYCVNVCLISKTKKHHRNAVNFNKCCEANLQLNSLLKCLFH